MLTLYKAGLKGVNGQFLDVDRDMSRDGKTGPPFADHARDALAFSLGYFDNEATNAEIAEIF